MTEELRVLVWAPRGRDASLAAQLLSRSGLVAVPCGSVAEVAAAVTSAGCAVLTEEVLLPRPRAELGAALAAQPPWSDFPIVLFAPRGADRVSDAVAAGRALGNVTVLERPVQSRTLVSAVAAALRGRRRQYEAREAIQRRDEFLAMLGHELRNPLAAIVLAVDALGGDAALARPREILERQTHHLTRLVDDLLDVARVTKGKLTLQRARVAIDELLVRCVSSAEPVAAQRGTALRLQTSGAAPVVDGDPVRLEEVLGNLISNAIKYSPDGAVVELASRIDGGIYLVDVVDHGVGIAPEMLPRVFELFAQAERSLDRAQGGLGVGLTVVKSLVELHGGRVEAHSDGAGKGSTFRVSLPLAGESAIAAAAAPVASDAAGVRVVLVDDNDDILAMTHDLLVALGCEVATASDGPGGLAQILAFRPEVALLDIGLPGMDGYELAKRARTTTERPFLVAMTGYGQPEDTRRALAAGFDRHLVKPISLAALRQVIASRAAR
jgi:signal transduction histidine kinase